MSRAPSSGGAHDGGAPRGHDLRRYTWTEKSTQKIQRGRAIPFPRPAPGFIRRGSGCQVRTVDWNDMKAVYSTPAITKGGPGAEQGLAPRPRPSCRDTIPPITPSLLTGKGASSTAPTLDKAAPRKTPDRFVSLGRAAGEKRRP